MKQVLLVFLGGGIGSVLRFLMSKWLNQNTYNLPFGTFSVNLLGSLLIGVLIGLAARNNILSNNQTLLLVTGFCGGFTTFSAFAFENYSFLKSGDISTFLLYTLGSVILSIVAVFIGFWLVK